MRHPHRPRTMSPSRKVPVFGPADRSAGQRVDLLDREAPGCCIRRIALLIENVPMRFAMKFGVSCAWTMVLPRRRSQKCSNRSHIDRIGVRLSR